ncbi:MAG: histidinol dehydrogenase [Nitrospinae bacterium]|nr:histidinol dehydrogenase [Nitrospinota bacterium]
MKIVSSRERKAFDAALEKLDDRLSSGPSNIAADVAAIIADVRKKKDKALFAYTKKFDRADYDRKSVRVGKRELAAAEKEIPRDVRDTLQLMADRIGKYHWKQRWSGYTNDEFGSELTLRVGPMQGVGLYVPGGKASYPSSVLMNAIPAKIAGVPRIVMVTPTPGGVVNPATLAAAHIAGVDEVYKIGGAQAIAALAYGTESVAPVDKIVGPGNAWVAEAKRQVFGKVDIDMIAGPSEVLVLADDTANATHIALDLLAQAEHDEEAYAVLVTPSAALAGKVAAEVKRLLKTLQRRAIASVSIRRHGFIFVTKDIDEAFTVSNRIAPEHFELNIADAEKHADRVTAAGALFIGPWTPEALGDYTAGSNHVLPTGGAARYASPLGVYDFVKRTTVLHFNRDGFARLAPKTALMADVEGLEAHGLAVRYRMERP